MKLWIFQKGSVLETAHNITDISEGPLANPYSKEGLSEIDAGFQYAEWLEYTMKNGDVTVITAMEKIAQDALTPEGSTLICTCTPMLCHGQVIKQFISNALKGKEPWAH